MPSIQTLLDPASLPDSPSARLDLEWLLAAALARPASYLRTWPDREVPVEALARFEVMRARRQTGEPLAYILGRQGFWSLELEVSPATLIPRPDTELLVETALQLQGAGPAALLDLGTGSGAIALALASERPAWQLTGVDRQPEAVALAGRNRQRLGIGNARFLVSDWFSALVGQHFALILANPPYIAENDPHLARGDVRFEPRSALTAGPDGLDDLRRIVRKAPEHLQPGGWLLLEHGCDQGPAVRTLLQARGFGQVASRRDLGGHERISLGRWS